MLAASATWSTLLASEATDGSGDTTFCADLPTPHNEPTEGLHLILCAPWTPLISAFSRRSLPIKNRGFTRRRGVAKKIKPRNSSLRDVA